MKTFLLILCLLMVSPLGVEAQKLANHGLVVTGSVEKVEAKCVEGKPLMIVRFSVQIRNDSTTPLILLSGYSISTTKFNFISTKPGAIDETVVAGKVVRYNPHQEDPFGPGTKYDYDPFAGLVKHPETWEAPEPIPPGGFLEAPTSIAVASGFKLSAKATEAFNACRPVEETPIPDYPSFYLEYHTSLKRYDGGENVMRSLPEQWKSVGVLPLDSSGDISYRSVPIIFPSPK